MRTISLVNMKGGVAKTTLAVNLADALNRREDGRVLLVDLDPQFNATQCLFSGPDYVEKRKKGGHTVLNVFDDSGSSEISLVTGMTINASVKLEDVKPWPVRDGFDIIPGDLELYRLEMSGGHGREMRLRRYLEKTKASEKYDYIIIDTPPTPSHWMISGLLASDHYLVPVKPEPLSRVGIDLLRGVINRCAENHGHSIECLGVVLTIADRRTKVFSETIDFLDNNKVWKDKRIAWDLPQRTVIARDQGNQGLILDCANSDARSALVRITSEVVKRIGNA
jgi:chromosome partitioning protein